MIFAQKLKICESFQANICKEITVKRPLQKFMECDL